MGPREYFPCHWGSRVSEVSATTGSAAQPQLNAQTGMRPPLYRGSVARVW